MDAQDSISAVIFSGQEHLRLEILKLICKLCEALHDAPGLFLVLEFLRDLYQIRKFICIIRQSFEQRKPVLKRLLLLQDLLGILLIVPETLFQALVFEFLYPLPEPIRVKDNLPLPRSAPAVREVDFLFRPAVSLRLRLSVS